MSLPAIEPSWAGQVRADPSLLADIAHAVRGPFHVLFPPQFAHNLKTFTDVIASSGLQGQVFFAKKANKAGCWLPVCAESGAGSTWPAARSWFTHWLMVCADATSWSPARPKANICCGWAPGTAA
ncbi:putative decarboxylase [Mycobacterium xenopi 3993]|nr:putative decarboxylase [Mycobacterium xenopi 3993]